MATTTINTLGLCNETTAARLAVVKFAHEQFGYTPFTRSDLKKAFQEKLGSAYSSYSVDERGNLCKAEHTAYWMSAEVKAEIKRKTAGWLGAVGSCDPNMWVGNSLIDGALKDMPMAFDGDIVIMTEWGSELTISCRYYVADPKAYLNNRIIKPAEKAMQEIQSLIENL